MKPIETIAIVGAGNMGSGIAQKTAQEQFPVQMVDREKQWVERGQNTISTLLGEAVERRIFSEAQVEEIQARITGVVGVENVAADTDLVIEAVFEDFDVKAAVFNTLDEACGEETILASNTSSLSVNALAEATARPDRFVGLHFFYHPAKNRLVEVIPSDLSSEETIARVEQYCKMLGKVVIVCKDRPGFVVNRFFVPWLNEACLLLEEGIGTTAQIDAVACAAFDIGMGPFALMNLAMGVARTPIAPYMLGTGLGILPRTAIAAAFASAAASDGSADLMEVVRSRGVVMTIVGVVLLIIAFVIVSAIGKHALNRVTQVPSRTSSEDASI